MMMFSGLRGAIAFALAIRNTITESRQMILSTTLLIVIVTVIINGGCANSVLKFLGIPTGVLEDQAERDPIVNSPLHDGYNSLDEDQSGSIGNSRKNAGNNNDSYARMSSVTSGGSEIGRTGSRKPGKSWLAKQWAGADTRFFKPLLTHSQPTLMDTLPNRCLSLARVFTSGEQMKKHPRMMSDADLEIQADSDSVFTTSVEKAEVLPE